MIASYVGRWSQAQQEQFQLCEKIDQIADRLPIHDREALDLLAGHLRVVLDRVRSFEEEDLFPVLEAMSAQMKPLLVTFRSHHALDRDRAEAIYDLLAGSPALSAEYLRELKLQLQSFAETLRRHVQFEEAIAMALFASKRVDEKRVVQ